MRRWNGWGDTTHSEGLDGNAAAFLIERLGAGRPRPDATREQALAAVPDSRLPAAAGLDTDAGARCDHARGQSFPDWVAMRAGRLGPYPDAVAFPEDHDQVAALLGQVRKLGAVVVPYGGGTSVVGHLNANSGDDRPVISLSLERMNRLLDVDPQAWTARLQAGTPGPAVEAQLRRHGFTLGHYPQSFEYSTIGGWVVTRSSGQQSLRYGRIEQMFHGGRLVTPQGEWRVGGVPATGAGIDMRDLVLGSEGRLGLLTEVSARVRPVPEHESFHAVFFADWASAFASIRGLAQSGLALSMLRLSNAVETDTQLRLAGKPGLIRWLRRYLAIRGIAEGACMLMVGITGTEAEARRLRRDAGALVRSGGGVWLGTAIGKGWARKRFHGPYLRNALWDAGYAVDTVETAVDWPRATDLMQAIETAARDALSEHGEAVHAFTHLSHVYRQGCSIYSTFVFRAGVDPDADLQHWRRLKARVSEVIVAGGGTISHQHGVGVDHAPWLEAEKGAQGMALLRAMAAQIDPERMLNPGKLFAEAAPASR
jgi:alkyldihydroxyacetonephosphate synthase